MSAQLNSDYRISIFLITTISVLTFTIMPMFGLIGMGMRAVFPNPFAPDLIAESLKEGLFTVAVLWGLTGIIGGITYLIKRESFLRKRVNKIYVTLFIIMLISHLYSSLVPNIIRDTYLPNLFYATVITSISNTVDNRTAKNNTDSYGPKQIDLGNFGELNLPVNYYYNPTKTNIAEHPQVLALGFIVPILSSDHDMIESGYAIPITFVKTNHINATALLDNTLILKSISDIAKSQNELLHAKANIQLLKSLSWLIEPNYNADTHILNYAFKLTMENGQVINVGDIKLLGSTGYINLTIVNSNEISLKKNMLELSKSIQNMRDMNGRRYNDYTGAKYNKYQLSKIITGLDQFEAT